MLGRNHDYKTATCDALAGAVHVLRLICFYVHTGAQVVKVSALQVVCIHFIMLCALRHEVI